MPRLNIPAAIAIAAVLVATPASAGKRAWGDASDVGRTALVVAALGVPAVQSDWDGGLQAGGSIALAVGTTYGLKHIFPEQRPDRSDRRSFPSGHTSTAFAAAASLHNRYGWQAGVPAYVVASIVGVGRVEARKHHWYDVVAGAAIGTGSGFLLTSKRDANVRLMPFGDTRGGGFAMSMRF